MYVSSYYTCEKRDVFYRISSSRHIQRILYFSYDYRLSSPDRRQDPVEILSKQMWSWLTIAPVCDFLVQVSTYNRLQIWQIVWLVHVLNPSLWTDLVSPLPDLQNRKIQTAIIKWVFTDKWLFFTAFQLRFSLTTRTPELILRAFFRSLAKGIPTWKELSNQAALSAHVRTDSVHVWQLKVAARLSMHGAQKAVLAWRAKGLLIKSGWICEFMTWSETLFHPHW